MSHTRLNPLPPKAQATFEHAPGQHRTVYGTADAAVRWALQEYQDDPETLVAFLSKWSQGATFIQRSVEFSEYRYWLTGDHKA